MPQRKLWMPCSAQLILKYWKSISYNKQTVLIILRSLQLATWIDDCIQDFKYKDVMALMKNTGYPFFLKLNLLVLSGPTSDSEFKLLPSGLLFIELI